MKNTLLLLLLLCSTIAVAQTTVDDYIKLGNEKEQADDFKAALTFYNKALELEPQNAEAIYYAGYMKFQMQDYMSAIQNFDNAIAIDSESVELYYARGNAKFEMKDYEGAR
ncbi:MAG: tetratricopeptide repeat protein [Bacteroidetes bacterium]|nr:tetratricopeptide repeat protein [Bacteroidota bacterium]